MSLKQNIIYIYFKGKHQVISKSQYQYNRGQYLYFADLNLPQAFEVHFSNKDKGASKTQIGSNNLVEIPDEYFWNGALQIYAWIYLHSETNDGETIYEVKIPLSKRAKPTDEEPLPVQQSTIDRAIAELNNAVNITTENANKTDSDKIIVSNIKEDVITLKGEIDSTATTINQKAQETINASERAETSARNAATSENNALDYSQQAEQSAQSALESKNIAQQKSEIATNASNEALGYKDEALEAKNQAIQAKQNIVDYRDETKGYRDETLILKNAVQTLKNQADETAEEIKDISDTVKEDAQSASQSASSASQSSINASQFASQSKKSADDAGESANQAEQNKNQTETFKNQSEEYKTQAGTFKSQAEIFKNQAEEFKNQTETNVTHYPKIIGEYWYIWDATNGEYINTNVDANGIKGDTGNGIASVTLNDDYTLTITFTDDTTYTTSSIRGQQGEQGDTGATGESGVYIGTEEPENEDVKVWIDIDESADSGTVEDLIEDINHLKEGLNDVKSGLNFLENAEGKETLTPVTGWQLGTLASTGVASSTYRAFSESLNNDGGTYQFDSSKYKLAFAYFDTAESTTRKTVSGWKTQSPAVNDYNSSYPYIRLYIEELSRTSINVDTDITINAVTEESSVLVSKVLENKNDIETLKVESGVVYVSTTGSDNNDGTIEHPFLTIQKAVDSGAETIRVYAGAYSEFKILNRKKPIRIMLAEMPAYTASATEQDLPKITITGATASPYHGIVIDNCTDVYLSDIHVNNVPRYCYTITNVAKLECVRCYASDNSVDNFSGFRLVNVNGILRDCKAWNITLDGFNIHGYGNTEHINCIAYDCGDDGISHHDSCTGCIIGGEYYGNGKGGISSPYGGAKIDVNGAYCHDNTRYGLYTASDDNHPNIYGKVSNCVFKNNGTADIYIADGSIIGWNNIYDTRSIQSTGTFTEF